MSLPLLVPPVLLEVKTVVFQLVDLEVLPLSPWDVYQSVVADVFQLLAGRVVTRDVYQVIVVDLVSVQLVEYEVDVNLLVRVFHLYNVFQLVVQLVVVFFDVFQLVVVVLLVPQDVL